MAPRALLELFLALGELLVTTREDRQPPWRLRPELDDDDPRHCYAVGCTTTVAEGLLMCGPHWRGVPPHIRDWVTSEWAAWYGQGQVPPAYLSAIRAARSSLGGDPPPALVSTPPATKATTCRSCGAPIYFARTSTGKLTPISLATNANHFQDCPQADSWRGKGRTDA